MTITSNDIKVFQAQDNTDNDTGGGSRTAFEIVDGDVNNLFPDISRIDTVSGDVALRKVFPTVYTENNDIYYGAHAMIRKVPTDPNVSALLFYTRNPHDKRVEAQNDIEAYVVASYLEEFWLYGQHVEGGRAITFLAHLSSQTPDVGNTYLLKQGGTEQYVRIESIDSAIVTLLYTPGTGEPVEYRRRRIICVIDQPLIFSFDGSAFHPSGQVGESTDTFATQIANAAKYYGTKTLAVNALADDLVIKVDDIYEQLVPASKSQTPLVNKKPLVDGVAMVASGKTVSWSISGKLNPSESITLPTAVMPNTLSFASFIDDGLGNLVNTNSSNSVEGTIDYKTGVLNAIKSMVGGTSTYTYQPAATVASVVPFTNTIAITQENSGSVFTRTLSPMPSPGDLYIDYRSQGKWYRFSSNPDGATLGTESSIGRGNLYPNNDGTDTGSVTITLGSLPDIDSNIIFTWGSGLRVSNRNNEGVNKLVMVADLGQTDIDYATFNMTYFSPTYNLEATITADANGLLYTDRGSLEGQLNFQTGRLEITQAYADFESPNATGDVVIDFQTTSTTHDTVTLTRPFTAEAIEAGTVTLSIGENVLRETVSLQIFAQHTLGSGASRTFSLNFKADGNLPARSDGLIANLTVDGEITITLPNATASSINPDWAGTFGSNNRYITLSQRYQITNDVTIRYRTASATYGIAHNITDKVENIFHYQAQILGNIISEVAINMLETSSTNSQYLVVSRNGVLYHKINLATERVDVGTIDYASGLMTLAYYDSPHDFAFNPIVFITDEIGDEQDTIENVDFRTSATKLTTSSFQMNYTIGGINYDLTSDGNGAVSGSYVDSATSFVDTSTGMASINFTTDQVVAGSIRYTAIAESSLPLDPELLGLNPVRLPSDGRVPVFDKGRHLVIFHENTTAIGTPVADQVVDVGRTGQSYIEVVDVIGKRLDPGQYVADKTLGTITFGNPLSLVDKYGVSLTAPFSAVDRVEDMLLSIDVQINGLLTLSGGLSRDYPANDTKVASALVWGDIGSRVSAPLFSQEIWDSGNPIWADTRIGDGTNAQYNDVNNPILVDNKSSTAGRWAIVFRSETTVDVIEENLGVVASGVSIAVDDVAPINPSTGAPYFIMYKEGFGSGWRDNNVVRLNTASGDENMWVIRTVRAGALSEQTDSIEIETRGDAN